MKTELIALRDSLAQVMAGSSDTKATGVAVNYRAIAERLAQEAITGANPVGAVNAIVDILKIPDEKQ